MINLWKKALLEYAPDIFERSLAKKEIPVDQAKLKDLHAGIGELTVEKDFLADALKPWTAK